jgi:PAS domain S-box-containing protein
MANENKNIINHLNESLNRSEEFFKLLVDAVADYAIFAIDTQGYILTWNTGAQRLKGYTASEIVGEHFSTFYTQVDKDRGHPAEELHLAMQNGKYEEEGWRLKKGGTRFYAHVILTPLYDTSGKHIGFSKVTRDLTERKLAEDAKEAEEVKFKALVESVKDYAILMLDPIGKVVSWNEGARRLKGYEASEIIGQHFSKFYPQVDIDNGKPEMELRVAAQEGRFEDEGWRIRKDGTPFWANVVITAIHSSHGLIGYSKVTRDLTESKKAEQSRLEEEEKYRLMIENIKDYAIFMLDTNGKVASWNEGARRFKGYEAKEIIGQHFSKFYPLEDIKAKKPQMELEMAEAIGRFEDEGWRLRKDGTRFWANVVITALRDRKGKLFGFSKVTQDLTDRKMAEEELKHAYENLEIRIKEKTHELEEALKSRDEFLSIASHELKTPITTIKMHLQMTQHRIMSGKELDITKLGKSLKVTVSQVERLTHLIDDLLDISRIQAGKLVYSHEPVNVSDLVEDIVEGFGHQLDTSQNTVKTYIDEELVGEWDRTRIEQVIVNLISNAIKYAPGSQIVIFAKRDEDNAIISVQDFGPGIPKEMLGKIFQRFERLGQSTNISGLGLGLFICKQVIAAHSGTINLKSKDEQGATFEIVLPLHPRLNKHP